MLCYFLVISSPHFFRNFSDYNQIISYVFKHKARVQFDYNSFQIESVCKLIMKTKMPQTPETLLEKILCDADLNYLGQDDFIIIGNKLLRELNAMGKNISEKEWNKLQIDFLEAHHYWTSSVISKRENKKAEHLQRLWQIVKDY